MLDHIGLPISDYARSLAFYKAVFAPLGYGLIMEVTPDMTGDGSSAAGFGTGKPDFWIGSSDKQARMHVAVAAADRAAVRAFYEAAMAAGAKDNGPPGIRALSRELLRRVRAGPGRTQHRSRLPRTGVA